MNKGLISVIIPNRAFEKNETLPSLKKQTYKNFEVIEVIDKDAKGASWARNQGLKKAKGEFIFWCDNDLQLRPDCLEKLHKTLQDNPDADWAFGRFIIDRTEFNNRKPAVPEDKYSKEFIDHFHGISTMSLIRASAKPRWDENLKRYDDWDLWIRLTREGHMPAFCDTILFSTVNRPHGITQQSRDDIDRNMSIIYKKHLNKRADIIIPHHNQHGMLANCLTRLNNQMFNIIIVSGGSFAENCNKGVLAAKTDNFIFLNDDTMPGHDALMSMVNDTSDITGIAQYIPHHNAMRYGIGIKVTEDGHEKFLSETPEQTSVPSGFCFKVRRDAWEILGGLDEIYINGAEDVDFFLKAKEKNMSFGYVHTPIRHYLSKSAGRFLFAARNEEIFADRWNKKLEELL